MNLPPSEMGTGQEPTVARLPWPARAPGRSPRVPKAAAGPCVVTAPVGAPGPRR